MTESFLQSLKWYILALSIVIGTSAFIISEKTGSMKPLMLGLLGYGVAYIMSSFWKNFRNRVLFGSIVVFTGLSLFSPFATDMLYVLFGFRVDLDPYVTWALVEAVFGIPLMMLVFFYWDD